MIRTNWTVKEVPACHGSVLVEITVHEYEVLQMVAGERPFPEGTYAWINSVMEFLQGTGFVSRSGNLTPCGKHTLERLNEEEAEYVKGQATLGRVGD